MKKLYEKIGKTKIVVCIAVIVAIIAAVLLIVFLKSPSSPTKTNGAAVAKAQSNYNDILNKDDLDIAAVEKELSDYEKSELAGEKVFTKGDITIHVKTDKDGKVNYLSYKQELGSGVVSKIGSFNESQIKIGDDEQKVLSLLSKYKYVYNLKTTNEDGKRLDIYYYGWTGEKAMLELVFTDGKLSYYTINSSDLEKEVETPTL